MGKNLAGYERLGLAGWAGGEGGEGFLSRAARGQQRQGTLR